MRSPGSLKAATYVCPTPFRPPASVLRQQLGAMQCARAAGCIFCKFNTGPPPDRDHSCSLCGAAFITNVALHSQGPTSNAQRPQPAPAARPVQYVASSSGPIVVYAEADICARPPLLDGDGGGGHYRPRDGSAGHGRQGGVVTRQQHDWSQTVVGASQANPFACCTTAF